MMPSQIRALPNADIMELQAYYQWQQWKEAHNQQVAEMRANHD